MTVARIRSATDADAAAIASLTTQLGYPTDAVTTSARLAALRLRTDGEVFVAVDAADRAIGWVHVSIVAALQAGDLASIDGLVVDEGHRSRGIGHALVGAAEEWSRARGATAITVRSRSTRERAHRFYARIGYDETKRSHVFARPLV